MGTGAGRKMSISDTICRTLVETTPGITTFSLGWQSTVSICHSKGRKGLIVTLHNGRHTLHGWMSHEHVWGWGRHLFLKIAPMNHVRRRKKIFYWFPSERKHEEEKRVHCIGTFPQQDLGCTLKIFPQPRARWVRFWGKNKVQDGSFIKTIYTPLLNKKSPRWRTTT